MSFRLSPEMIQEIAGLAFNKGRVILLTRDEAQATKAASHLRETIQKLCDEGSLMALTVEGHRPRLPMLRPEGRNPSFVQVTNGGWVFLWPANDMTADDDMGSPQVVYWPSEGGAYERVTFSFWQEMRRAGEIYRPVTVAPTVKPTGEPRTVWDRLLVDEDE